MAPFLWCFGVLKVDTWTKSLNFQRVSDLRAKMAVWRFTTDEVIRFIMDISGDGTESNEENTFRD